MRAKAQRAAIALTLTAVLIGALTLWPKSIPEASSPCRYDLELLGSHDYPELLSCDELHENLISQLTSQASEARQKAQKRKEEEEAAVEAIKAAEAAAEAKKKAEQERLTPTQPILDPDLYWVSSNYGVSEDVRGWVEHDGVDYAVDRPDVQAVAQLDAEVIFAQDASHTLWSGCGLMVALYYHSADVTASYCHLSAIHVQEGDKVAKGISVGTVGSTGLSTGPHLHYMTSRGRSILIPDAVFNPNEWK